MDHNKKQNIIIVLCSVLIIGLIINNGNLTDKIDQLNSNINSQNYTVIQEYQNISQLIHDTNRSMREEAYHVVEVSTSYDKLNYDTGNVEALVTFRLKEFLPDQSYYVSYSPIEEENYIDVLANNKNSNTFEVNLTLPLDENYKLRVLEKGPEGGIKELNMDEAFIHVYNDFQLNIIQTSGFSYSESEDELMMQFDIINESHGFESNEIKEVLFLLYHDETLVLEEDITNQTDPITFNGNGATHSNTTSHFGFTTEEASNSVFIGDINSNSISKQYYIRIDKNALAEKYPDLKGDMQQILTYFQYDIAITLKNGSTTLFE